MRWFRHDQVRANTRPFGKEGIPGGIVVITAWFSIQCLLLRTIEMVATRKQEAK
jgi:hypothetical protein